MNSRKERLYESFEKLVASNGDALRRLAESSVGDSVEVKPETKKEEKQC